MNLQFLNCQPCSAKRFVCRLTMFSTHTTFHLFTNPPTEKSLARYPPRAIANQFLGKRAGTLVHRQRDISQPSAHCSALYGLSFRDLMLWIGGSIRRTAISAALCQRPKSGLCHRLSVKEKTTRRTPADRGTLASSRQQPGLRRNRLLLRTEPICRTRRPVKQLPVRPSLAGR